MSINKNNIRTAFLSLMAAGLLASCDFEENCPSRGELVAYVQNDSKEISPRGYADRNLVYFPGTDVKEQTFFKAADVFTSDTLRREIPSGTYDLILFNRGTNMVYSENGHSGEDNSAPSYMDNNPKHFVLRCPVEVMNGQRFLPKEQIFICSAIKKNVSIERWKTTKAGFTMRPVVKFIRFRINVLDDDAGKPVRSFKGYLSGVTSSKNLGTMKNGSDYGTQIFTGQDKKGHLFTKGIWVFGVNGAVSNILTLVGTDGEGREYTVTTDITDQLENINNDGNHGVEIKMDVYFKPRMSLPSVEIAGWENITYPPSLLKPQK